MGYDKLFFLIALTPYIFTCNAMNANRFQAPLSVPASEVAEPEAYHLRTRIIIEMASMPVEQDGKSVLVSAFGASADYIMEGLENAEKIYKDLNINFVVDEIIYHRYTGEFKEHIPDALQHVDSLSIYYMLPNEAPFAGLSSVPWESLFKQGIYLSSGHDKWTLAHELGHYFGLFHTFDEDYIEETAPQKNKRCETKDPDQLPNCRNIMNYCRHLPKMITPQQIDRMKRFLRSKRMGQIIMKESDLLIFDTFSHLIGEQQGIIDSETSNRNSDQQGEDHHK